MSRFRFETPQRKPAPRPSRLRQRQQPIPRNAPAINVELNNWRAEVELVLGVPRADRKKGGDHV
jgi:hypothetical protein